MIKNIKSELQEIADTIKAVVGIDITIMDNKLERIAGTGKFKKKVGSYAPKGSVFEKSLKNGKHYFLENPKYCKECLDCSAQLYCDEKAEICFPIIIDNKVQGVIGMIIFDEEQKNAFLEKIDSYTNFEIRIVELIASKIKEKHINKKLEYKSIELMTVIDSVDEGILIIDKDNKILCVNKYIKDKLKLSDKIINSNINEIIPQYIIEKIVCNNYFLEEQVVLVGKDKYYFLLSVVPIKFKKNIISAVITLRDFNKLQKSIIKVNENINKITFDNIIGGNQEFLRIKKEAKQISKRNVPVLLLGESGTGKELFARSIHAESERKNDIFMAINCGAIPENLLESELFGYEKGAFTGADRNGKMGKFEIAKDGTIFLDEIGELPLHMQVKLLRALEQKEIVRVGGLKPIKVSPRIIAATNRNLYDMIKKGEFREDLFYRLNVIPIEIPSLKDRKEDIIELAMYFLGVYNTIYGKCINDFTESAKNILLEYSWPGNIRELQNLVEYAINFEQTNNITEYTIKRKLKTQEQEYVNYEEISLKDMINKYEKSIIEKYIAKYGSSTEAKKKIAKKLNISTATLYRKLEDFK